MDKVKEKRIEAARNRILEAANKEIKKGEMTSMEILAVMAYSTGSCIALQDQRKVTPELALEIVAKNIEAGNRVAIQELDGHEKNIHRKRV